MTTPDRKWLLAERPHPIPLTDEASDRALNALLDHVQPSPPRRRSAKPRLGLATAFAAAVAVLALTTSQLAPPSRPAARHATAPSLALVAYRIRDLSQPQGDATLVIRHQAYPGQPMIDAADLYVDDGRYFFARVKDDLPAEVAAGRDRADGLFAREVTAARFAATGDLTVARKRVADAVFPHPENHPTPIDRDEPPTTSGRARSTRSSPEPATRRPAPVSCA